MSRARFTVVDCTVAYEFKVYIEIWQDDDWSYTEFKYFCKSLVRTGVELNTSSYKAMSDQLYLLITEEMPGRDLIIIINNGDIGLTTEYNS